MTRVIAGMTMSLDGFVADHEGSVGRLYSDFAELQASDVISDAVAETGAVLMGRTTFEMASDPDSYADTYEFQVPIVVVTREPPAVRPKENDRLTFTFATDGIEAGLATAAGAAGDRAVTVVGGAEVIRQLLVAGLVDELHLDIMPVLLGEGLRLFDDPGLEPIELNLIHTQSVGQRVALRYRVVDPQRGEGS